jgi:cytochrome P450
MPKLITVSDPAAILGILKNPADYPLAAGYKIIFAPLLGRNTVFLLEGEDWKHARNQLQEKFTPRNTRALFLPIALDEMRQLSEMLRQSKGAPESILYITEIYARNVICRGISKQLTPDLINKIIAVSFASVATEEQTGLPAELYAAKRDIFRFIDAYRKNPAGQNPDEVLYNFVHMTGRDGRLISNKDVFEYLRSFMLAGYYTTRLMLAHTLSGLLQDESVYRRAQAEVRTTEADWDPKGNFSKAHPYVTQLLDEAMRFQPPIRELWRGVAREHTIRFSDAGDVTVAPGDILSLDIAVAQRAGNYPCPHAFSPGNLSTAPAAGTYIPFSQGPRVCLGLSLAMIEGIVFVGEILRKFDMRLEENFPGLQNRTDTITFERFFSIPKGDMLVSFTPVSGARPGRQPARLHAPGHGVT